MAKNRYILTDPNRYCWYNSVFAGFVETDATPITIPGFEQFDLFVVKHLPDKRWKVTEGKTGQGIANSFYGFKTKKKAIEVATDLLSNKLNGNKHKLHALITKQVKIYGLSPRYRKIKRK